MLTKLKMHVLFTIFILLQLNILYSQPSLQTGHSGLPVLKGVTGFGVDTKGGSGGKIIKVTNLNKDGKGSLAEAASFNGPRIVVFEVAGVIDLDMSSLRVSNPFITIAGQTAPSPGITLIRGGLFIQTHDVIIQHIKIRPGEAGQPKKSGWEVDGLSTAKGAYNVIVDHCSATWATDENLSASGPRHDGANPDEWKKNTSHRVMYSNCIIAEGLSNSTHGKGEHSKGTLIHDNASDILIIGNLYAHNMQRNPLFKGGVQGLVVNNYIYNPGNAAIHFGLVPSEWEGYDWLTGRMVIEGNVIEYGNDTRNNMAPGSFRGPVEVYWKNNKVISKSDVRELTGNFTAIDKVPFWPNGLILLPVENVREWVLDNAGAFPWDRDEVDKRIIADVRAGKGKIIDSEQQVGGYPVVKPVYRKFRESEWDMNSLTRKK